VLSARGLSPSGPLCHVATRWTALQSVCPGTKLTWRRQPDRARSRATLDHLALHPDAIAAAIRKRSAVGAVKSAAIDALLAVMCRRAWRPSHA